MQKCLQLACAFSWNDNKNAKNSQVRRQGKIQKPLRSAVMQKYITGRSAVTKQCRKVTGLRSPNNAKKLQVRGQGKMPKTRRSAVTEKYKKCIHQHLCKNA